MYLYIKMLKIQRVVQVNTYPPVDMSEILLISREIKYAEMNTIKMFHVQNMKGFMQCLVVW